MGKHNEGKSRLEKREEEEELGYTVLPFFFCSLEAHLGLGDPLQGLKGEEERTVSWNFSRWKTSVRP